MTDTIASLIARLEAGEIMETLWKDLIGAFPMPKLRRLRFEALAAVGGWTDFAIAFTEAVPPSRDYGFETEGSVKRRAWVAPAEAAVSIEAVAESAAVALVLATLKAKMGEGK